ncbi:MAG: aminotransferase class V-fold PLP-dependent enzyme [Chitinivibrionales bacterium]|nr:aminotransferase class V-fold PLP-dependent enzyme [Chitinivibrionales bacterium]MBD3396176.1 aminotransferase class V-fold PLP-dependent enzyme [Chitinivibrionales bacterium]
MHPRLAAIEETLLMGPGPSCVPPQVYEAIAASTIGHMDPRFVEVMDEVKVFLQKLLNTSNKLTIPMSGTGSAGMETCFVNLVDPGDSVLVLMNGVFGKRMADVATRLGAKVDTLEFEWGTPVIVDDVKKKLDSAKYTIVAIVHAETSTGVCNPVAEVGSLLAGTDSLYLVDTVTSLGGIPVEMDAWGIDALYSGTQKCLSCPPGLAPVSFSEKALGKLGSRKNKVPNWYLDLTMITQYWEGRKRVYHHTAPVNMIYALHQALALILDEGLENVYRRHMENHQALAAGLEEMGLSLLVKPESRLPMLNAVCIPEDVDDAGVRSALLNEHRIEIGAGLGPLAGKVWRIGLMGHTARRESVDRLCDALKSVLN